MPTAARPPWSGQRPDVVFAVRPFRGEVMEEEGWYVDPYGIHEARWVSAGSPTALVRDGDVESQDPPPDTTYVGPLQELEEESVPKAAMTCCAPTAWRASPSIPTGQERPSGIRSARAAAEIDQRTDPAIATTSRCRRSRPPVDWSVSVTGGPLFVPAFYWSRNVCR
jgi:hypothetical protein